MSTTGYNARFTGSWQDGWISNLYDDKMDIGSDRTRIVITGPTGHHSQVLSYKFN
jgi:hypothetical protein